MALLPNSWEKGFKGSRSQGSKLFVFQGFDHCFKHSLDIPDFIFLEKHKSKDEITTKSHLYKKTQGDFLFIELKSPHADIQENACANHHGYNG